MRTRFLLAMTAIIVAVVNGSLIAAPATLPLAEDGRALQPIVISQNASDATKAVATELAEYLKRITGATFDVQTGDGSHGIVLGTLSEFPIASLEKPLEIRDTYDGKEAFAIRTEPQRLLLIGATDLAVSHAAFRFLERIGCRWFFPAREWEVVPRQSALTVSLDETDRPRILARRIWYGYGTFSDKGHPQGSSAQKDYEAWARHNCMASSFRVTAGHAWQSIILANKQVFDEHPEYRALVSGTRQGEQLCVSNPEVRRLARQWALSQLERRPESEMVSMECSDGYGQCECDECAKLGSVSDRVFGLANDVARAVAEKSPGKMVGCLAYSQHSEPPSFDLEPNVYVQLTAGFIRGPYTHEQLLELWPKKCRSMGYYEYFSVWLWDFDKLPGGKGANITRIREAVQRYVQTGATSFDAESGNNWGVHGRGYYIANKLLWNPDADVHELLADFYQQAFGPAAPAMQRYYDRVAPENEPLLSRGLIGEALRDVEEAARLASDRPDVQARLDQIKHYLRYVHLRWLLDHEQDKSRQKELTVATLTHVYRTRYEYMNHWAAMRQTFASDAAKKFDEPTWLVNDRAPKLWMVEQSVSREESDEWFRDALDFFQPTPVTEVKFAYDDLVPSALSSAKPAASSQAYQQPQRYALASVQGEPLAVEITPGTIAWYRDRADARYTLTDRDGQTITQGTLKLDGEPHQVIMNVPRAGTYFFECNDSAAGWRIKADAEQPITWLPQRGRVVHHLGQFQELFFYVPKGTQQVQLFYSGGPCKVLGPDRKPIAEITVRDEVVTIPVAAGTDGQCWSLAPHGHSQLWFFNVPNCLAASPSALLLPRSLVDRDGL
jgi:hypothetical protein